MRAAVNDAMAHGFGRRRRILPQALEDLRDRGVVTGDTLDESARDPPLACDRCVHELVLERRAARVDGQDHHARSLKRWIFPVAVLGSSVTKSIQRGYLYGAILSFTKPFISSASAGDAAAGSFSTTNACGLTRRSLSSRPTTAASRTAACLISVPSTSIGETQMPPTLSMSSARPAYQK